MKKLAKNENKAVIEVRRPKRATGMGAITKYRIYSLRQKRELLPKRIEPDPSRTKKPRSHWDEYWYLLPGKYFISWKRISNSGNHSCGYGLLVVSEDGWKIKVWQGQVPEFAIDGLCDCLKYKIGMIEADW